VRKEDQNGRSSSKTILQLILIQLNGFFLLPEKKKHFHPENVATMEGRTIHSNLKAMLAQAGTSIYKGFQPFTAADMKRYIGLMMLHGLAPSP
jgi:hypothetical protein